MLTFRNHFLNLLSSAVINEAYDLIPNECAFEGKLLFYFLVFIFSVKALLFFGDEI
jgi:hypothetical protein